MIGKRSIAVHPIQGQLCFQLARKANKKRIYVTHVATIQTQRWEFISTIPTDMIIYQLLKLNIILLLLWISLEMDNFTMTRVWFISRAVHDNIVHVLLSTSDELFVKLCLCLSGCTSTPYPTALLFWTFYGLLYSEVPLITIPLIELKYYATSISIILLGRPSINGGILYHTLYKVSERETFSIPSDHVLVYQ